MKKNGKVFYGGVKEPKYQKELIFDIEDDEDFDFQLDKWVKNGKRNLYITGSNRALKQLGVYLINLSMYKTTDPDYHDHIDDILDSQGKEKTNVIFCKRR